MRVSHSFPAISTVFDDANLVSCAGLAPTMALAHRAGLGDLVADTLTLKSEGGVNARLKVPALVAGMVAGADCIDDMDLLRHGGMGRLFTGCLLYTSDAADDLLCVDLGGRRIIKKKKKNKI